MKYQLSKEDFRYGIEAEFFLADRSTFQALWHEETPFQKLNGILERIELSGIPSLDGLELEPPHRVLMPYVVEGYHLPDQDFNAIDILPKGVEIRTPVCNSLEECLKVYSILFKRLDAALEEQQLAPIALSHHPIAHTFKGPQNKRRHDFWAWAMEVMTTYGPDINLGIPAGLMGELDLDDFMQKVNFYSPAMTALSVASPFRDGGVWKIRNQIGKSLRTYRRSIVAPPIEVHPKENNRLEFKMFDMTNSIEDFQNYFLLFIALLMSKDLRGRASQATRIYDLGAVARYGIHADGIPERIRELLDSAYRVLPDLGFCPKSLERYEQRSQSLRTPADELLDLYFDSGDSLAAVLQSRSQLIP